MQGLQYNPVVKKGKFEVRMPDGSFSKQTAVDMAEAKYNAAKKVGFKEYWKLECLCVIPTIRESMVK